MATHHTDYDDGNWVSRIYTGTDGVWIYVLGVSPAITRTLLQQRLITRLPLATHFLEKHVRLIGFRYDGVLVLPHKGMAQVGHSTKTATNPIMALAVLLFDTC